MMEERREGAESEASVGRRRRASLCSSDSVVRPFGVAAVIGGTMVCSLLYAKPHR
jgi:hypothetical protein